MFAMQEMQPKSWVFDGLRDCRRTRREASWHGIPRQHLPHTSYTPHSRSLH